MSLLALSFLLLDADWANSPFIVPVAGCAMILGIVVAGTFSRNRANELRSRERLECIARGITPPPTAAELAILQGKPSLDRVRRRANIRLTGIILVASSIGLAAFFIAISVILRQREVLSGAAVAFVPLAMGLGFLYDSRLQSREIAEPSTADLV